MNYALESLQNDCKNCYKCIRGCPTKSISFSNNQASIIHQDCILCGKCYLACPQKVKIIRNDLKEVQNLLHSGKKVIVSLAPSFIANYPNCSINTMKKVLKQLGFYDVEETAVGATIVKNNYDEMILRNRQEIIISSCCHSINLLIQKHYQECLPYLAKVLSPMLAHGQNIKKREPDAYVVFIGPCIAKKDEVDKNEQHYVDYALTFLELDEWLKNQDLQIEEDENKKLIENSKARLFPIDGGILKTMKCDNKEYEYLSVSGIENAIQVLEEIKKGNLKKCFIEMSSCSGSCINGPAMSLKDTHLLNGYIQIKKNAGMKDFQVENDNIYHVYKEDLSIKNIPSDLEIERILKEMGKTSKEKEFNCGSCGYPSCKDKAIAIFQGKAVKEMCLPYLMEKAASFSNNIVKNTPNGIMVLNTQLEIQQINKAMCRLVNVEEAKHLIGLNITTLLAPDLFLDALEDKIIKDEKQYLLDYDKYVETTIIYDKKFDILISIMRDITAEQKNTEKRNEILKKSMEITNEVIEKNMRTVQEIASLLGESAAETKVALLSLKDTLKNDE